MIFSARSHVTAIYSLALALASALEPLALFSSLGKNTGKSSLLGIGKVTPLAVNIIDYHKFLSTFYPLKVTIINFVKQTFVMCDMTQQKFFYLLIQ